MVAFSLLARILGECLTIHSLSALFLGEGAGWGGEWRLADTH